MQDLAVLGKAVASSGGAIRFGDDGDVDDDFEDDNGSVGSAMARRLCTSWEWRIVGVFKRGHRGGDQRWWRLELEVSMRSSMG